MGWLDKDFGILVPPKEGGDFGISRLIEAVC